MQINNHIAAIALPLSVCCRMADYLRTALLCLFAPLLFVENISSVELSEIHNNNNNGGPHVIHSKPKLPLILPQHMEFSTN